LHLYGYAEKTWNQLPEQDVIVSLHLVYWFWKFYL